MSIESRLKIACLQDLVFDPDFKCHTRYKSIFTRKATLERILGKGGQISLALLSKKNIVGFAALDFPDSQDRWSGLDGKVMMELKAVEISRKLRNNQIAKHLLSSLLSDPKLEYKIIYLTAYSWTWDLEYAGLSKHSYRNMLIDLYSEFRFTEYQTNEPNICLKPENIFMARIGKHILKSCIENFKWLRFGILDLIKHETFS